MWLTLLYQQSWYSNKEANVRGGIKQVIGGICFDHFYFRSAPMKIYILCKESECNEFETDLHDGCDNCST
jgi:hypothetical protein